MNDKLLKIIMTSPNPKETLLSIMNPDQRKMAEDFLRNPNDEALNLIMKKYNITQEQLNSLKSSINSMK